MIWSNSSGYCTIRQENTPLWGQSAVFWIFTAEHYDLIKFWWMLHSKARNHTPLRTVCWNSKIIFLLLNVMTWSVWWKLYREVRNHTPLDHLQKQKARMCPLYTEAADSHLWPFSSFLWWLPWARLWHRFAGWCLLPLHPGHWCGATETDKKRNVRELLNTRSPAW